MRGGCSAHSGFPWTVRSLTLTRRLISSFLLQLDARGDL